MRGSGWTDRFPCLSGIAGVGSLRGWCKPPAVKTLDSEWGAVSAVTRNELLAADVIVTNFHSLGTGDDPDHLLSKLRPDDIDFIVIGEVDQSSAGWFWQRDQLIGRDLTACGPGDAFVAGLALLDRDLGLPLVSPVARTERHTSMYAGTGGIAAARPSVDASMLCQPPLAGRAAERRAACSAASPASRVAVQSLRDGRGPPLTPEPRRPLWGSCGQARACPRGARRPAADHGGCAGQAVGVGCAAARRRKTWRAM